MGELRKYWFLYILIILAFFFACGGSDAGEVRKLGKEDLLWCSEVGTGTWTSPGGVGVTPLCSENITGDFGPYINASAYDSIQDAIDAASAGDTVYIPASSGPYTLTSGLTISKSLNIISDHATINVPASTYGITVSASDVVIDGVKLVGAQYTVSNSSERGISVAGSSEANAIENIFIRNSDVSNFGFYGIYFQYVHNFDISHNTVEDIYYGAIEILSGQKGRIAENYVNNVIAPTQSYGIQLSREETDSITTDPLSADITISGNVVNNVLHWVALGSHGGRRLVFSGNSSYGSSLCIGVGSVDNGSNEATWAPKNITIAGNVCDSGVTDGSAGVGITLSGAYEGSPVDYATGTIVGNIIKGYGDEDLALGNALYLHTTVGVSISGNTIDQPGSMGILAYHDNKGLSITGNTFIDVWSNSGGTEAININSDNQTLTIDGNLLTTDTKSATYINTYGISSNPTTPTTVEVYIGKNDFSGATYPYYDSSYLTSGSFHGSIYYGSVTYDPPSLDNGASVTTSSPDITNIRYGDLVYCTHSQVDTVGIILTGNILPSDDQNARCTIQNLSGGTVDIASGTLSFYVVRP